MSVLFTRLRPKWFTPVAQLGVLWHLAVAALLIAERAGQAADYAPFAATEQLLLINQPGWLVAVQFITVTIGAFGALMLATKKSSAVALLSATLLSYLLLLLDRLLGSDAWALYGFNGIAQPLLLFVVSGYLMFLTHRASAAGWLR
jgi:hypothetical protein